MSQSRAPFPENTLKQIAIVDYLEYIRDDAGFVRESAAPSGTSA